MNSGTYSTTDSRGDTIIVSKVTKTDIQNNKNKAYVTLAIGLVVMVFLVFFFKRHVYLLTKDIPFSITEATIYDLLSDGVIGVLDSPNILLMALILGSIVISIGGFASEYCSAIGGIMYEIGGFLLLAMKYPINLYITELSPSITFIDPNNSLPSMAIFFILLIVPLFFLTLSCDYLTRANHPGKTPFYALR